MHTCDIADIAESSLALLLTIELSDLMLPYPSVLAVHELSLLCCCCDITVC